MSMTEKIKIALIKRNMSVTELANILGSTPQNLSAKFRRDNFCEKDLQETMSWPRASPKSAPGRWNIGST